jgi:hypothetical protein
MARLQRVLQHGRPVVDIGVLYPIASLQAGYRFGVGEPYKGGIIPEEADYMDLGDRLALEVRQDFTFVHPEVLDARCAVAGAALHLDRPENPQQYRVFIIPGSTTIGAENLGKIKEFFDCGGRVIATTRLPDRSAEFGRDEEVRNLVAELFGAEAVAASIPPSGYTLRKNDRGGMACFAPAADAATLKAILAEVLPVPDVAWEEDVAVQGGNLSYLHKVIDGRQVYFFANSSDTPVDVRVALRSLRHPELWDPHDGTTGAAKHEMLDRGGETVCRLRLELGPVRSVFVVGKGN